jgi:hypothetical protein
MRSPAIWRARIKVVTISEGNMPQYTRFWDVFLTHHNGWCDFATEIEYAGSRQKWSKPGVMTEHKSLVHPTDSLVPTYLQSKPTPPQVAQPGHHF